MQLKSLYIDNYKLLKDFTIDFNKEVSILIGINGSGKSSILECLAQIFSDAYLQESSKFGFKLVYEMRLEEILLQSATTSEFKTEYIKVEINAARKYSKLRYKVSTENEVLVKESDIEKKYGSLEKILPSNIVIYYSGQAEIMKRICLPHNEKLSKDYRKGNTNMQRSFFYFEPPLFNLILLTLLSYQYGDVPTFLLDRAKIKGVQSIKISLRKPSWGRGSLKGWWGAKGEVKTFLDYLEHVENEGSVKNQRTVRIEDLNNDAIVITIIGQEKLFEIREHFVEEKTFFKMLNTLYIDGFQPNLWFSFIQEDASGQHIFNILSEGEQQAIIIRGLIELANNEHTLFLFDEPDTYLHPSWQRNFIESINELSNNTTYNNSQFLITTHSPQLLSNADPTNCDVQIMEDGEIVKVTPKYYGRDIGTILYEMMGVERQNPKVAKLLSVLFNAIEEEDLEKSILEYEKLAVILGEDDPTIVRAKLQLDYLKEEQDEANN
jgi:predicted ATP-binding protein involved in virulence